MIQLKFEGSSNYGKQSPNKHEEASKTIMKWIWRLHVLINEAQSKSLTIALV